jgi:hypothetical protein
MGWFEGSGLSTSLSLSLSLGMGHRRRTSRWTVAPARSSNRTYQTHSAPTHGQLRTPRSNTPRERSTSFSLRSCQHAPAVLFSVVGDSQGSRRRGCRAARSRQEMPNFRGSFAENVNLLAAYGRLCTRERRSAQDTVRSCSSSECSAAQASVFYPGLESGL